MMNKGLMRVWAKYQDMISEMDDDATPITIFMNIKKWYTTNRRIFKDYLIKEYKIEELIESEIQYYPLAQSEVTSRDIKRFLRIEPHSESGLLMSLRDLLWELLILIVDVKCCTCGDWGMFAMFDSEAKEIVFECLQWGHLQTMEGHPSVLTKELQIAKNDDLKLAKLI